MNCFSFLSSTCVAMIDLMSEQLINTEYQRFKDVLSVLSVSTPSKTTNKTTTRSDRKREVLKTALLQIISQEHIGTKTQLEEIQSMLNDIKEYHSTTPTKLTVKEVATNTEESNVENVSTSTSDLPFENKDASTSVEERTATSRSSTEMPTRSNPVPSHPSECPSSSSGTRPPPIRLPGTLFNPKKDLLLGKSSRRTLFLSDSILSRINANSFKADINETSVKKTMYYFSDFSNFEPEFGYCDKIVISAGINDLTRKRLTPEQICDVVLPQLRRFSALYPNSKFIINSVILTSDRRINKYIFDLNKYLFDGINRLKNVYFFSSHSLLDNLQSNKYIHTDSGIGIHIANYAIDHIKMHLVRYLRSRIISSFFYRPHKAINTFR